MLNIYRPPISVTNDLTAGNESFEGVLGSAPNIICQICRFPGHSAISCYARYQPKTTTSIPALASFAPVETAESLWYPDSAAAAHMTPDEGNLSSLNPYYGLDNVQVGNGNFLPIAHTGCLNIPASRRPLALKSVLHVPHLKHNLLSIKRLSHDDNYNVIFTDTFFSVKNNTTGDVLLQASSTGNLYPRHVSSGPQSAPAFITLAHSGDLWHNRLGHCGACVLNTLRKNNIISISLFHDTYVTCRLSKLHHLPF